MNLKRIQVIIINDVDDNVDDVGDNVDDNVDNADNDAQLYWQIT